MKKLAFTVLMLMFASSAFAAYSSGLPSGLSGALSTNVQLDYTSSTDKSGYAAASYHSKGTKTYGSSSGDAAIFSFDGTGEAAPTAPTGTASADFGGWTSL